MSDPRSRELHLSALGSNIADRLRAAALRERLTQDEFDWSNMGRGMVVALPLLWADLEWFRPGRCLLGVGLAVLVANAAYPFLRRRRRSDYADARLDWSWLFVLAATAVVLAQASARWGYRLDLIGVGILAAVACDAHARLTVSRAIPRRSS